MKQETDINQFVEAINSISSVRDYDEKILETAQLNNSLACWAIIISLFVALITIIATIYIFRRQEKIIKEQLQVSNQQNKIALFDKRYESYQFLSEIRIHEECINQMLLLLKKEDIPYQKMKSIFTELFRNLIFFKDYDEDNYEDLIEIANQKVYKLIAEFKKPTYFFLLDTASVNTLLRAQISIHMLWGDIFCNKNRVTKEVLLPLLDIVHLAEHIEKELFIIESTLAKKA